jgi:hypothetical protein
MNCGKDELRTAPPAANSFSIRRDAAKSLIKTFQWRSAQVIRAFGESLS